ncbi:hypothetical protein C9994_13890 [Marivirga lumbricoides]|uniref:Uncharacterized protein n=1 Tax=Marivirga lumbricoides TaxID=1046115 RepID=A0A2T4DFF7_9BACT|nr:hypothetical protein C9994_13890 [Marivirga lumbricoides]
METTDVISLITYLFFIYLILAIFIERTVEIFMAIISYLDCKLKGYSYWNKLAHKYKMRLDRLYDFQGDNISAKEKILNWILWDIVTEKSYEGGKHIISAEAVRFKYFRLASRIFAFLLSSSFALFIKINLNVDLISLLEKVSNVDLLIENGSLKVFLTAVALSVGSEPLHALISKFENIGKDKNLSKSKTG